MGPRDRSSRTGVVDTIRCDRLPADTAIRILALPGNTKPRPIADGSGSACTRPPPRRCPRPSLCGSAPNRESAARIQAALARPITGPDRLAIARLDARLKALGTGIAAPEPERGTAEILSEIKPHSVNGNGSPRHRTNTAWSMRRMPWSGWRRWARSGARPRMTVADGWLSQRSSESVSCQAPNVLRIESIASRQQKKPRDEDWSSHSRPLLRSLWWAILDSNQ